jgi:zinc transport system substrate-binding protein
MNLFSTLRYLMAFLGCLMLSSCALAAEKKLPVLVSIKPLMLIAQEIAGEQVNLETLLPIQGSPHDYPLKISDVQRLRAADLVLWVGPDLETFLTRSVTNLPADRVLTTLDLPGLYWPAGSQDEAHHGAHGHSHSHVHDRDPHLWLDPRNAVVIAQALAARLALLDPASAAEFKRRAEAFAEKMAGLDDALGVRLASVQEHGFAVYHEGYTHFVNRYGLRQLGYVAYSPHRRPGAKHLYQLRQALSGEAVCVFAEPYYDQRSARELSDSLGLRMGVLDPIGAEHVESYKELLEEMAVGFLACLAEA